MIHICMLYVSCILHTNDMVFLKAFDHISEYRRSLWFFLFIPYFFFFLPQSYILLRENPSDLWVSLTQPTWKGTVSEVWTWILGAVFVCTPHSSLPFLLLLGATHGDVSKTITFGRYQMVFIRLTTWSITTSKEYTTFSGGWTIGHLLGCIHPIGWSLMSAVYIYSFDICLNVLNLFN